MKQFNHSKGNQNTTSNQPKVKNTTHNYIKTATKKSLVENFLKLNHKTLPELNAKYINGCHSTNVARRMIKINTIRVVLEMAKKFQFHNLFSTCTVSLLTSILSHLVQATITTQSLENRNNSCDNLAIPDKTWIYFGTEGVVFHIVQCLI